jgi:glycosyltransferase involved in cell wall biosynthesis
VVVVDDGAHGCDELFESLGGDVEIVCAPERSGPAAALALGLERSRADHVVLLRGTPVLGPGWLAPLQRALADQRVAGAASATAGAPEWPAAATQALAIRRRDLEAIGGIPAAPDGLELAALVAALGRRGEVATVAGSVVLPAGERDATSERVRIALRAIDATVKVPHEVILVDNGAAPQGFTAPVNAGLRATRGAYVVVMNDDVEPLPGWWDKLRERLDLGESVAYPLTVNGANRTDFAAWCFAMPRQTLEDYAVAPGEFFDPELVVWYQDTDLLQRLRDDGRPPSCVTGAYIKHSHSQTVRSKNPELRAWVKAQVAADEVAFLGKHGTGVAGATPASRGPS